MKHAEKCCTVQPKLILGYVFTARSTVAPDMGEVTKADTALLYKCQVGQPNMIGNSVGCERAYINLRPVGNMSNTAASGLIDIARFT